MRGRKKIKNKNKRQSKRGKEGGKPHLTTARDPLDPLLDFVAMKKNTKVGETWRPREVHSRSTSLKMHIILRFNFFIVNH